MEEVLLFLPCILILGIITSYTDIKYGKIKNKWVLLGLAYSFLAYLSLIAVYSINPATIVRWQYLLEVLTNFLFSLLLGFGLWYFKIWTAGDGKLFIAYSALIPLSVYSNGYQKWVPSTTLFLNTFIIGFIAMSILLFSKLTYSKLSKLFKSFLNDLINPKKIFETAIILFAIFWIAKLVLSIFGVGKNIFLMIILTILIFSFIHDKIGKRAILLFLAIVLLRFAVDKSIYSLAFLGNFVVLLFIWTALNQLFGGGILNLGQEIFSRDIGINELNEGMILVDTIAIKGKKLEIKPKQIFGMRKGLIDEEAEGLTEEQIKKLRSSGIKRVRVAQTIPFAPLLFLGAMLTIIAKGNIFIVLKLLIFK
jgi:hypothetical protein